MDTQTTALPPIVSHAEWQAARDELLAKEKAHMRASDALAARRRRLPMVKIDKPYTFEGTEGKVRLIDLFEGRRQLIIYHFMFGPTQEEGCPGCSLCVDNFGHLAHLRERDTTLVLVSRAPLAKLLPFKKRMGWTAPWYSSFGTDFNTDFNVTVNDKEQPGLSVFIRDGDTVYRTYFTTERGLETLGTLWGLLDATPLGRQETWEDSPAGWPKTPAHTWWRYHDKYVQSCGSTECKCH